MKFGTIDISNIQISILISKIIFKKFSPTVRPKLVPKLKVLRIYWNLAHSIFQICQSKFWCQKWFSWNIYLQTDQSNPKIKINLKFNLCLWYFQYSNLEYEIWYKFHWTITTCYAKIGLRVWIPISIINCEVIFMKYTHVTSVIILKSL